MKNHNLNYYKKYYTPSELLVSPLRIPEVYNEHNTTNIESFL